MSINSSESGEHTSKQRRSERAQELGLDENASWADINKHTSGRGEKLTIH